MSQIVWYTGNAFWFFIYALAHTDNINLADNNMHSMQMAAVGYLHLSTAQILLC